MTQPPTGPTTPQPTRSALIDAAASQFNSVGYFGTDTNKIARTAGFAPQTFYRHFLDKLDVLVAVYEVWQQTERDALALASRSNNADREIAKALLEHHRNWKVFRQSLRLLAVVEEKVRRSRACSRERQLDNLAKVKANSGRARGELLTSLLCVERICDAAADGELKDLGLSDKDALILIAKAVHAARNATKPLA